MNRPMLEYRPGYGSEGGGGLLGLRGGDYIPVRSYVGDYVGA